MMSPSYADGITDTVPHHIASNLPAGQTAAGQDTPRVPVTRPDRRFPGGAAAVTSRDRHTSAGQAAGPDACTGQAAIKPPGS